MKEFTIPPSQEGQRLDHYLAKLLPQAPAGFCYRMLRKKSITRNGKRAEGKTRLQGGDRITLFLSDETFDKFSRPRKKTAVSVPMPEIVFEDDELLAVNKPDGLLTQPGDPGQPSLSDVLTAHYDPDGSIRRAGLYVCSPAHRLDRNTSGIVLCGKTLKTQKFLSEGLREGTITKIYRAVVHGTMTSDFTHEAWLSMYTGGRKVRVSDSPTDEGEKIVTEFIPLAWDDRFTDVKVILHTGKKHQIRAHLSYLGYPVVGDRKYGSMRLDQETGTGSAAGRQLLHAWKAVFPDECPCLPQLAGKALTAPLPKDIMTAVREIRS